MFLLSTGVSELVASGPANVKLESYAGLRAHWGHIITIKSQTCSHER